MRLDSAEAAKLERLGPKAASANKDLSCIRRSLAARYALPVSGSMRVFAAERGSHGTPMESSLRLARMDT